MSDDTKTARTAVLQARVAEVTARLVDMYRGRLSRAEYVRQAVRAALQRDARRFEDG